MSSKGSSCERKQQAILVNFTNGTLGAQCLGKFQAELEHDSQSDDECIKKSQKKQKQTYLTAQTKKMKYRGALETSHNGVSYYLGVRDPRTGKMQVLEASKVNMFPVFQKNLDSLPVTPAAEERSYREKMDSLTKEFGSLKRKRGMESRKKLKLEKDKLEKTLENATDHYRSTPDVLDTPKRRDQGENESILAPPCNREAEKPQDVYNLTDIISDKEMNDLTYAAQVFKTSSRAEHKEWKENSTYPMYILNHLSFLPLEEKARLFKSKCLIYMHYLMHIYKLNAKALKKAFPLPISWPTSVREKMYTEFMMSAKQNYTIQRYMPARFKDKVLLYILVLGLVIDNFHLELADIIVDLKVSYTRLLKMLTYLGCHVKKNKGLSEASGPCDSSFRE